MSSNLRIGGLATGLDTDQIVKDLMKAERMRLDSLKQKKQLEEWKRTDFRTVNNSLRKLRDSTFNLKLQGTFMAKKAASSNEAAVTATASSSASVGSYSIVVDQLAQGVTKGSKDPGLAEETNADGSVKTLQQQFATLPNSVTFTLEGKLKTDGSRASQSFTIDTTTATINTLASEINKYTSTLGITANYDSANNRFFLSTTGTGSDYGINVTSDASGLLSDATGAGTGILKLQIKTNTPYLGQNAQFDIGDSENMTSKSNTVTVNGITLTLKQGGGASSTITVSRDVDTVYNSIKSFIEQYNATLDEVNKELAEERYKDYLPLTDDLREELSEKQEEQWEEKAKSGMLRNDSLLSGTMTRARGIMASVVTGISSVTVEGKSVTYNSLSAIGIVTGDYSEKGKLYLKNNGEDLKKALENDPDGILKLFTNDTATASEKGIAKSLYDQLNSDITEIVNKAGFESAYDLYDSSTLGKSITDYDKRIKDMEKRLLKIEDRYYKQFTAMEKAISQMNSQSAWLSQQFNSGQ